MRFEQRLPEDRLVWVTRTAPYNKLTERRVRGAGRHPLLAPALRVVPIVSARVVAVPNALVFTSLQGVRTHRFFPGLASLPVFAVGDRSARFARLRGYRRVFSAEGDVGDLHKLIRATMPAGSEILHLSAAQPAGDLLAMLRDDGFIARRQCVYEAVEANAQDLEWVAGRLHEIDTILVHSPRAGRLVASWLQEQKDGWRGTVVCISAAAAAAFSVLPAVSVAVASMPNESELMALLKGHG